MSLLRSLGTATLAAALSMAGAAFALGDPPPWAHANGRSNFLEGGPARSHAVVSGTIVGVDYGAATILVDTPDGRRVPVAVTPTTSIFRDSGFASLSDIGRGARVSIDVTEIDGRLVAQIIRIH